VLNLHKSIAAWASPLEGLSLPKPKGFRFFKPGSYEKDFRERVSKNIRPWGLELWRDNRFPQG
jgi:hypothetical protein